MYLIDHQTIQVRIDHERSVLSGVWEAEFSRDPKTQSTVKTIDAYFIKANISAITIDGHPVTQYQYGDIDGMSAADCEKYDIQLLSIPIPSDSGNREKFTLRVAYSDDHFYGEAINPEDDKPFSLGQITANGAFSSHLYYYPYLPYEGRSADLFISSNLPNASAVSSGSLIGAIDEGSGFHCFHFRTNRGSGMLSYPFSIATYNAISVDTHGTTLEILYFPGDDIYAKQRLPVAERIFELYTDIFGSYPFPRLSIVEISPSEGNIALAAQSVVMMSQAVWFGVDLNLDNLGLDNAPLLALADEINHQWNAYKVNSPNFLAEGISRYVDSLVAESLGGPTVLTEHMKSTLQTYFWLIKERGIADKPIDDPDVYPALYFIKGALALNMLRAKYGYDVFKKAMRRYFSTYDGKVTTIDDFRSAFEAETNDGLDWFFDQWYHRAGWPRIEWTWASQKTPAGWRVTVNMRQAQDIPFKLAAVPVVIHSANSTTTMKCDISGGQPQSFSWQVGSPPESVELDPDSWILMEAIKR